MQEINDKLKGTGVAIVTPFKRSGEVDVDAFGRIIDHVIAGGVEYIVVMGTTGESPTVTKEEKKQLLAFAIDRVDGRIAIVAGYGGNNTAEVIRNIESASFVGIDAVLSVSPYYNKPQQQGLYEHFRAIAGASPVPVILYNVPGRTGMNVKAETTLRLANDVPNIIGIKEASGNFDQIYQVIARKPANFLVISGDDSITLPLIAAGADGVISVAANIVPVEMSEMVRAGMAGNFDLARKLHYKILDLMNALFMDGSPAGVKAALEMKGLCLNVLRLPLVGVNPPVYEQIKKALTQIEN
jgi:4-hydroxy-tetrahydrodipicolinate synthase